RVVRGQYEGYRSEAGVAPDSDVETFVALEVGIDTWRWSGVPFYLRTGKSLAESRQVITIGFKEPPRLMFQLEEGESFDRNELVIDFADPGSITTHFLANVPGPTMELGPAHMTFKYGEAVWTAASPLPALSPRFFWPRSRGVGWSWALPICPSSTASRSVPRWHSRLISDCSATR